MDVCKGLRLVEREPQQVNLSDLAERWLGDLAVNRWVSTSCVLDCFLSVSVSFMEQSIPAALRSSD